MHSTLAELCKYLEELHSKVGTMESSLQNKTGRVDSPHQVKRSTPHYGDTHGGDIELHMHHVNELENIASGETVDVGSNHHFNLVQEVTEWMQHSDVNSRDIACDLMSTLIAAKPKRRTGQE
jgi:hypothetical protein